MTPKVFTKEELMKLTTKQIKSIDISNVSQESIINEILNERLVSVAPIVQFNYRQVPNITKPEQEKEWQANIDAFNAANKPVEAKIVEAEAKFEEIKAEATKLIESVPAELEPVNTVITAEVACDQCEKKYGSESALKSHKTKSHKVITN